MERQTTTESEHRRRWSKLYEAVRFLSPNLRGVDNHDAWMFDELIRYEDLPTVEEVQQALSEHFREDSTPEAQRRLSESFHHMITAEDKRPAIRPG